MYKTLLMAVALIAPVMAQDAPEGSRPSRPHGPRPIAKNLMAQKLLMDKYDANKDGKLDDAEKVALKADAEKLKEARKKERLAKWDKDGDGKFNDEEKAAMKAEHEKRMAAKKERMEALKGKEGEAKADDEKKEHGKRDGKGKRHPGGPRGERPDFDMIIVGQALVLEKYDTDKDGKISKEENEALKSDFKAARKALKDAGSEDAPEPPPAPEKE